MSSAVLRLAVGTQSYDWGKIGSSSKAARCAASGHVPGFEVDESKPYAELWIGTHVSLPSRILDAKETLSDHLATHPELIGSAVSTLFEETKEGQLPFLLKILSIRKALSIQAHPDKNFAQRLHAERPDIYKDGNHKPEMAIALTPFTALCGFRPYRQISTYLESVPELCALIRPMAVLAFKTMCLLPIFDKSARLLLRMVFSDIMTAPVDKVTEQVRHLVERYKSGGHVAEEENVRALAIELDSQFPNDVGVFCVFLLNVVQLQPGEAVFLGAGEPHAYISGDIVETMATSDNVLRAGLTPKMRDVPNLVASLTYRGADPDIHTVMPASFRRGTKNTLLYDPPIPEFAVLRTCLSKGEPDTHEALKGPSVLIVTQGTGRMEWVGGESLAIREGSVFFVGAGTKITFEVDEELVLYRAFVEA